MLFVTYNVKKAFRFCAIVANQTGKKQNTTSWNSCLIHHMYCSLLTNNRNIKRRRKKLEIRGPGGCAMHVRCAMHTEHTLTNIPTENVVSVPDSIYHGKNTIPNTMGGVAQWPCFVLVYLVSCVIRRFGRDHIYHKISVPLWKTKLWICCNKLDSHVNRKFDN